MGLRSLIAALLLLPLSAVAYEVEVRLPDNTTTTIEVGDRKGPKLIYCNSAHFVPPFWGFVCIVEHDNDQRSIQHIRHIDGQL